MKPKVKTNTFHVPTPHELRSRQITKRLNKVLDNMVVPRNAKGGRGGSHLSRHGYFGQVAHDTAVSHNMRAPRGRTGMTNVMRRVVRGETADSWVLDLIEMTLLRFESGDFSNNQPVPVKSAPRAEKSKPHVISLEEFEALTHAEADEEPLLASELEGPWIETIEAHVVDQPTPAKRNKLWVPADDGPSVFRTTEQIVELLQRHSPAEMVKIVQMVGINIPQEVSDGS